MHVECRSLVSWVPRVPGPSCPGSTRALSSHEGRENLLLCFAVSIFLSFTHSGEAPRPSLPTSEAITGTAAPACPGARGAAASCLLGA